MSEYITISKVKIRREPKIVEYYEGKKFITNQVGLLDIGTRRTVYRTVTDAMNVTWGQISEPDAAGISLWVCIKGLNREYMRKTSTDENSDTLTEIAIRLIKLEVWAKTKGYKDA